MLIKTDQLTQMTYYKNSLFISYSKARGVFLGLSAILFLFLFTNSSEAFFHKKEKNLNTENAEITEDLYSKMNDKHIDVAAENLLIALETKSDNQRHRWVQGSFEGYIIPFSTFINELGYFCRDYVEVIVRYGKRYNVYENNACRDHDGEWVWIETRSANQSDRF